MQTESLVGTTFKPQPSYDTLAVLGVESTSDRGMRSIILKGRIEHDAANEYDPNAMRVVADISDGQGGTVEHQFGFAGRDSLVHMQQQIKPIEGFIPCTIYCEYFSDIYSPTKTYKDSYHYVVDDSFIQEALTAVSSIDASQLVPARWELERTHYHRLLVYPPCNW